MSYAGDWHGSGQIPARAVDAGDRPAFRLDRSRRRGRHRAPPAGRAVPAAPHREQRAARAGVLGHLPLQPVLELHPVPARSRSTVTRSSRSIGATFYGGKLELSRACASSGGSRSTPPSAAKRRNDDIHEELWDTAAARQRHRRAQQRRARELIGAYFNEEITPARWLRGDLGGRADLLSFAVDNRLPSGDPTAPHERGRRRAPAQPQGQPDRDAARSGPGAQLEVYANYGHGFHSNDVRGVFAQPAVTPLARAMGEELGARARLFDRWDVAAALWQLDLTSETVWNGDDGTTAVSDPTTRQGRRGRDALRGHALAGRRSGADLHEVALHHRRRERGRAGAGAQADLGGRAVGAARARPRRGARRPALLRDRRSPRHRRRRADRARVHAGRSAPRLSTPLVRRGARHREPARRRVPLGAVRHREPPARRAGHRRARCRPASAAATAAGWPRRPAVARRAVASSAARTSTTRRPIR